MHIIYKLWNEVNDKLYIGQTTDLSKRARNGRGYSGCSHLYHAIQQYGWDVFHYEVLAECESQEEANTLEIYYISFYDTTNSNKGYNLSSGGAVKTTNIETKEKISKSVKQLWQNPSYATKTKEGNKKSWTSERRDKQREQIQKMRDSTDFQNKAQEGFKKWYNGLSKEEQDTLTEKRTVRKRKKVICLTTGEIFNSMREACDKYHLDGGSLTKACQGKLKHTGKHPITGDKLTWTYYQSNMEENK